MKDVIISVKGLLGTTEDGDDIELVTDGKYSFKDGKAEFEYMESELTGMEGTKTSFTVSPNCVMITRKGTVTMQMMFEEGRKNYFAYKTPFGAMTMGIDAYSINSRLDDDGGCLEVKYLLDMSNSMVTRNTFNIDIRKA